MRKRHFIKIGIVLVIVGIMSFSDLSFAADSDELDLLNEVSKLLHITVSILSWIWVFFAQGAGEFLTNKWVYGEILGLDVILWKFWNVVKNIANFGLGFYFIYLIFISLVDKKGDVIGKIKSNILYLLLAGIGIQSSWFLTAVVLDVSTITLATAGSFPSLVISEVEEVDKGFELSLEKYLEIEGSINELKKGWSFSLFDPEMGASNFITLKKIPLEKPMTKKELYDTIMPNSDNVAGPLYYLGFSILRVTTIISPSSSGEKGWMSTIFNTLLQGGTTIVFSIEMLVLLVVAVIRLLYMWVFIVLSPIVLLLWCIQQGGGKLGNGKSGFFTDFMKHFNITSFFWNAFKPTLIVLAFSVAMIFMTLMNKIILSNGNNELDMGGMKTSDSNENQNQNNGNDGDKQYTTIMDSDFVGITIKSAGKTIFNFILSVVTVVLIYLIIKFAVNLGTEENKDFMSDKLKNFQEDVEAGIGSMPLVPVSGWDENGNPETHYLSAGKTFGFGTIDRHDGNKNLIERQMDKWTNKITDKISTQTDELNNLFGWSDSTEMSEADWRTIEKAGGNTSYGLSKLKAKLNAIPKTSAGRGFRLDPKTGDKRWIDEFEGWLKDTKVGDIQPFSGVSNIEAWKAMVNWWKEEKNKNKSLEDMFKDSEIGDKAVKAYAEFFGLGNIESWGELKEKDISKKEGSEEESEENAGEKTE